VLTNWKMPHFATIVAVFMIVGPVLMGPVIFGMTHVVTWDPIDWHEEGGPVFLAWIGWWLWILIDPRYFWSITIGPTVLGSILFWALLHLIARKPIWDISHRSHLLMACGSIGALVSPIALVICSLFGQGFNSSWNSAVGASLFATPIGLLLGVLVGAMTTAQRPNNTVEGDAQACAPFTVNVRLL
jgi:hypothetical protein